MEGCEIMAYLALLVLGGLFNLYNFNRKMGHKTEEEMPYKNQGYMMAFLMGSFIFGGALCLVYWLIS